MMNYKDVVEFESLIEGLTDLARAHGVNEQDFVWALVEWMESSDEDVSYVDIMAAAADIWTAQKRRTGVR
jgi:hypothetical protein